MRRPTTLCRLLLLWLCAVSANGHIRIEAPEVHVAPSYKPAFVRSAVESMPLEDDGGALSRFSVRPSFGDTFLPLRSAVESVPTVNEKNVAQLRESSPLRSFVRDSVEAPPSDEEEDFEEPINFESYVRDIDVGEELKPEKLTQLLEPDPWTVSDKYAAFIAPGTTDDYHPQPYRAGSAHQELLKSVDIEEHLLKTVNIEQLEHIDELDPYREPQYYGALAQANLEDQEPAYGALAHLKAAEKKKNYSAAPKVLCYMSNWAFYRKADGQFAPEQIDPRLCSAIIYSFASLDPDHLTIREFDPWVDIENQYYKRITSLGVPVLIAMGGWTDSSGDKYSRLVSDDIKRKVFASSVTGFLQRHGFSGLHLDWNYPKCWQSDCSKGPSSDKPNLTKLLRELRTEFQRVNPKLQLGVAISGYKEIITEAYELSALSDIVDYMTVMTYDYHGAWERQTGHVSPLYGQSTDKYPQYNTDYTMQLLVKLGARREKLILSIPFYGQSFTLGKAQQKLVGEGVAATGPGEAGELTKQPGMLAYYEICQRIRKSKWQTGRDSNRRSGPYAMMKDQWVGYEDTASVEAKARYAANNDFAGVAAWTVDLDDFQNRCCSESYPLLKAINRALGRLNTEPPTRSNCERPPAVVTPVPPQMTTISSDGSAGSGQNHQHTTAWPSWEASSTTPKPTTTSTRAPTTTTKRPKSTTASITTSWWSSTTTRRPSKPTRTTARPAHTTIPAAAVIYPVVQPSNCAAGEFYADSKNCNAYYHCIIAGELRQQFCPGGLHWNNDAKGCDWPASAQCSVKRETSTARPPVPQPSTARPQAPSTSKKPRKTTAKPSRKPTKPSQQQAAVGGSTTRRPSAGTGSTSKRPSAVAGSTTKKPHRTTRRPRPPMSARCNEGEYYTHKNCGKYYICINGALVPSECGGDLHWDGIRKICDWPQNVQCVTSKKYLRITQSTRNSEEDPCNGEERVPYPGDCSKYLFCLWNRLQAADCPPGLHYNEALRNCDWPAAAKCNQSGGSSGSSGGSGTKPKPPAAAKPAPTTKKPTTTPRPTYPTEKPLLEPLDGYYKVVCYFTNWAWYRKGLGRYTPDDINTDLCTHVVYGFAVLDYSELTLRTHDSWADIDNNFYTRVSGLKSKGIKVSLALGGWNDSQGDKYSRLVRSPSARARFIRHALEFIEKYGFEGLDLDWEYPVCWQTECNKGFAEEKEGFTAWVRELSEAFKPRGLLLSTAVSPSKKIIDAGYDVPELSRYFDWIAVMTYDFHGQWDKKTGHVAPLYHHPDDDFDYFNANYSLNYWIEKGAPSRKIVMGMPLYGQSFTLENANNNGLNAKAPGPGQAGEFTKAAGFLAYYEICDRVKHQGWEVIQDERGRMGPYARKGTQWVSYDDPEMIRKKSQLVRALDLGGGMVWALDLDDFRNRCGDGVHPLLREIHDVLKDPPSGYEPAPGLNPVEPESVEEQAISGEGGTASVENETEGGVSQEVAGEEASQEAAAGGETSQEAAGGQASGEAPGEDENEGEAVEVEAAEPDHSSSQESSNEAGGSSESSQENEVDPNEDIEEGDFEMEAQTSGDFKVVCYFTNWAWYRQGGGKFLPEDIDADLCTHIVYGFAVLNRDKLTIQPHDSWADLDNKFYERVVAYRKKGVKVTVAIGGWNDSAGDKYARLVRSAQARARFIRHVMDFIEQYGFDGLDLDWEYPVCWQVDCKKGTADEKQGFTDLVRELSLAFKPKGLLLSSAVSPNKKVIDAGYDVPELSRYFDWIAVMAYDYHGQWDKQTGHVAPMYEHPDGTATFNANFSINYWLESGADRKKLIMGMPMYGQSFSLAQSSDHQLNAPTYGGGEAGEATRARGFLAYYEICSYIRQRGWNVVRDARGRMGPFAYLRDQWVSFDDAPMIRHKSEYVKAMGLGGAMIWALDLDDFKNDCGCESYPLLKTINRVLRGYGGPHPKCLLEKSEKTMISGDKESPKPTINTSAAPLIETSGEPSSGQAIDCKGRNYMAHERDCNKYYICQYGELLEQRCPAGLHWNENYCDWPNNAKCSVRADQTTQAPAVHRPKPSSTTVSPAAAATKPTKKPFTPPNKKPITRPKPTPAPPLGNGEDYKVVCYFTNWAWYRPGQGKYVPEDIDANLCTHIVYGFAVLNSNSLTIKTHDSWADIDNRFYERVVEYKQKGLRVTVAIGGWNDSLGSKYARLVLDPQARARFIESVLNFVEKYGFEGLDLDWEYPVCWQVDCAKGSPAEKQGFAALVRELSDAFRPRGLLLSAAVSPSKMVIDAGYDVPQLSRYFDWIAVMTYDFHGHWDKQTGHVAPLYYVEGDANPYFNGNFSIHYWLDQGTPASKLIMGMPLYGQSFSLTDQKHRSLNDKTAGPGQAGTYTRAGGFLAYYEICEKVSNGGWTVVRDDEGRIGPYAYSGNQWVSYDDVADIRRKAQFVRSLKLGGGMVWALDLDDFHGRCGCGKHPLLRTLNQELRGIPGQRANDCT
ncbi:probable chitinase 10 [Drosophila miranda]|uniref:probable chitinase 10 n=1 Tax=Drosophila miranda TaxID=7229 RepID=UPI0007E64E6A|nr:probable chitinase 10 [Drosophila miranda]